MKEPEQAEELDPLSAEILEKIKKLRSKIESIHRDAMEQGDSRDTISRKLGPYSRDIKKLQNQIERAESPISETVISALEESERASGILPEGAETGIVQFPAKTKQKRELVGKI